MTTPDSSLVSTFIQARKYTKGPRTKGSIGLLVIHATAGKEVAGGARAVANWFADPNTRDASANYVVDDTTAVQCVRESDIAWGAAKANHQGIHIEHVGLATQTPEQWADPYSHAELTRSIALAADICRRNSIPAVWLMPSDLLAGKRGITSHLNVDHAWPSTGHTDPGPGFPAVAYVAGITAALGGSANPKLILHTPDGRLLAWSGAMKDGARIVRYIATVTEAEALLASGWRQVDFSGSTVAA